MTLEEHINKAREDYPNGYSDYIAKYPTDTIDLWISNYPVGDVDTVNGYTFDRAEMSIMDMWEKEKFYSFIGLTEYNIQLNK